MRALLMAGGRGQRLKIAGVEKPLLKYKGEALFVHVFAALERSRVDGTIVVTSPHTPSTTRLAERANMFVIEAPGGGYIEDYRWVIERLHLNEPILIVAADLPLLTPEIIDKIIDYYAMSQEPALAVYVPFKLCDPAGCDCDFALRVHHQTLVPAAVNVVDGKHVATAQKEAILTIQDEALLYNINTVADLKRLIERRTP